ncbi:enzymatic polyprotein, Endonuclease, Reverse transcriptase [Pseudoloma neurophilia]|uniref:Enzymatic polyprotein, Endonuclease, Reverse transcriptase n=1 Tax=Pseudoloma neurophilia TaxID=146866 RepID=A0A0R0LXA6_9MICR|nr:enzymatic polyprotein, Endonuclease, Reverse transcriptase [Pseudoloma neurophilia]
MELAMPDFSKEFILESDASDIGLGATLSQEGRAIFHISRVLHGAELNYSVSEKEFLAALWAMEKLKYYLIGRKFSLITDHLPLKGLLTKKDFGNARMGRWLDRLNNFTFDIVYREGSKNICADSLSRNPCLEGEKNNETQKNYEQKDKIFKELEQNKMMRDVLRFHKENGHRKTILKDLKKIGLNITKVELTKILSKCYECAKNDKIHYKSGKFIVSEKPGEIFSVDVMDLDKRYKIFVGIDFFSRKIFAKLFDTKFATNTISFLDYVYEQLPFICLQTDNGREFENDLVRSWASRKNVNHIFSTPHYHPANGRIERAIRTIREGVKRTKGPIKNKLQLIVDSYNNLLHRGIGTSPNLAIKKENWDKVKQFSLNYSKEFKQNTFQDFLVNQNVLIKNVSKNSKMDAEFSKMGKIIEIRPHHSYLIEISDGTRVLRHASHLRIWPGSVGDDVSDLVDNQIRN